MLLSQKKTCSCKIMHTCCLPQNKSCSCAFIRVAADGEASCDGKIHIINPHFPADAGFHRQLAFPVAKMKGDFVATKCACNDKLPLNSAKSAATLQWGVGVGGGGGGGGAAGDIKKKITNCL